MEWASEETLLEGHLTGIIIRAFFRVYDRLGYGFLEQVYCRALAIELRKEGVDVVLEAAIDVWYDGESCWQVSGGFTRREQGGRGGEGVGIPHATKSQAIPELPTRVDV